MRTLLRLIFLDALPIQLCSEKNALGTLEHTSRGSDLTANSLIKYVHLDDTYVTPARCTCMESFSVKLGSRGLPFVMVEYAEAGLLKSSRVLVLSRGNFDAHYPLHVAICIL